MPGSFFFTPSLVLDCCMLTAPHTTNDETDVCIVSHSLLACDPQFLHVALFSLFSLCLCGGGHLGDVCHMKTLDMDAPRLQSRLPEGFNGVPYIESGWCFVEACGICDDPSTTSWCVANI